MWTEVNVREVSVAIEVARMAKRVGEERRTEERVRDWTEDSRIEGDVGVLLEELEEEGLSEEDSSSLSSVKLAGKTAGEPVGAEGEGTAGMTANPGAVVEEGCAIDSRACCNEARCTPSNGASER